MKVITGTARGAKLITAEGLEVRPTTDMVKQAIFNIIQFEIEGRRVLDLFAGSGQLGIEALSRGAAHAVFVDVSRQSVEIIKTNLEHTRLADKAEVVTSDFAAYLQRCGERFDIAVLDPPYGKGLASAALPLLARVMQNTGVIVCETAKTDQMPDSAGGFSLQRTYAYGKIAVSVYRRPKQEA